MSRVFLLFEGVHRWLAVVPRRFAHLLQVLHASQVVQDGRERFGHLQQGGLHKQRIHQTDGVGEVQACGTMDSADRLVIAIAWLISYVVANEARGFSRLIRRMLVTACRGATPL